MFASVGLPFDRQFGSFSEDLIEAVVVVETISGLNKLTGTGNVVRYGNELFIITVGHVLDCISSDFKITVHNRRGKSCFANLMFSDSELDVAILRIPNVFKKSIDYKTVIEPLNIKDAVAAIVQNKTKNGYEFKFGVVSHVESYSVFTTTIGVTYGDSGAPVFVFQNGKTLFVGIMRAKVCPANGSCYSQAVKLDPVVTRVFQVDNR